MQEIQKNIFEITHNGKTILFFDFSKCSTNDEMMELLESSSEVLNNSADKMLTLIDVTNAPVNNAFMARAQELSKEIFQYKREKGAILGINGLKAMLLKAYNLFSTDKQHPFKTREEALEWLTA